MASQWRKEFPSRDADGIAHGEAKEWYTDGTEKSSTIYRHGLGKDHLLNHTQTANKRLGLLPKRQATRSADHLV